MIMLTPGHRQIEANCILFPVSLFIRSTVSIYVWVSIKSGLRVVFISWLQGSWFFSIH